MKSDDLRSVVAEWLEEWTLPSLVPREVLLPDLNRLKAILAIVGPRRSGKTFLMFQMIQTLLATPGLSREDVLFVDFEDYRLADFRPKDMEGLLSTFNQLAGKLPRFVFFDEVQHLAQWSRVLRTLHNQRKYTIVISGSNSELLGQEIATELRGRYQDLLMLPLSLKELLRFKKIRFSERMVHTVSRGKLVKAFDHYLREGGFPEVAGCATQPEKRKLLQSYYRTLFYRDILERHHIRAKALLERMMNYCLDTFAETFSISAFAKRLKQNGMTGSKRTIANYLHYLGDAFFLIVNEKFAFSPTRRIMNPKKIYLLDPGFSFLSTSFSENRGKILENAVAIEMLRRRYEMFYFKESRECDFVIKQGTRPAAAVQVCWELTPRNEKRETSGLQEAMQRFGLSRGLVLTYDQTSEIQVDRHRVPVLPAWRWMLEGDNAGEI